MINDKKYKKMIYFFLVLIIMEIGFIFYMYSKYKGESYFNDNQIVNVKFPNGIISAEVANSLLKKEQGLSDRISLDEDKGMLFIFNSAQILNFWMNKMNFPLDFVWINDDVVVDLSQNISFPNSENFSVKRVSPKNMANKVLEINSGLIKKLEIKIGDKINFFILK